MPIKLYFTGKLKLDRDSLIPSSNALDVGEEHSPRISYHWEQFTWLGKTLNIEKTCSRSVPFLFFFLANLFSCRKSG